ncbi:MAG: N(G),N(G)-dimethylarginine dimethylaminohydrolase [Phycisphaerales bacterium]|nr:MAG: N(G),N(G)-dimethylarginine dimethylaminohydrolase [Phycisphaerales bacterium]
MLTAITREVSPGLARCELTHLKRRPINLKAAIRQHRAYCQCLAQLGCNLIALPAEPGLPDSVFVEDAAVVLDELAVITRPGAESRRGELAAIEEALTPFRQIERIRAPATLDGGDVLHAGSTLYVGITSRTNRQGVAQLREIVQPHGYRVKSVSVTGCLHLKSACTFVGQETLLINRGWVDEELFGGWNLLDVDPAEPAAANALLVGETIVYPTAYPRTRSLLEDHEFIVKTVDNTELAKAEGGVTCCSLILSS